MGGGSRGRGTATRHAENVWARDWALPDAPPSDYAFLVDRLIDRATLDRAEALAKKWGVLPHAVMIANGWLLTKPRPPPFRPGTSGSIEE